ncbi:BMP family lipoprotein [Natrinema altunense]|uniref:Basic membrane lipoprotein n=1 Tax=Natrinema altunense (strain JCM 12890 / CGMCC 1.3731 / AJ2) TaxID=1227494 RepID=L9ZL83_NATA2|nr:BMP family protein [Natrinema altunense]ELY87089.1 basic membrane lipoprotein [Natrinema altunense JCM 12890]
MTRNRRQFLEGASAVGLAGIAGCVGGFGDGGSAEYRVGMVYATGGTGDDSFNDMAKQGLEKALEEFDLSYEKTEPGNEGEFPSAQRTFAESGDYDLINCIGYAQAEALRENAPEYPDQNFIIVDEVVDADNVRSYTFNEPEGSFQVGHLAGLLTDREFAAGAGETNPDASTVGFVGGTRTPLIESFEAGFRAGVEYANDDAEVVSSYVGDFNDTGRGQSTARSMYKNNDADIVFHAAGRTGVGVFQAAQDEGRFAIGVDDDQSLSNADFADVILASMVKRVDTAVYNAIESVVNGTFEGGKTKALGLEQDGVGAVYGDELGAEIPQEIKDALAESKQALIDGEIDVPSEL